MEDKKLFEKAKNIFNSLKQALSVYYFLKKKIDGRLFKKFKKSKCEKDKLLLKLILLVDNLLESDGKIPTRTDYIEKSEIDRSTFYSFDGSFQLIHADVRNLEFLYSSATTPRYVLFIVELYSSEIYMYPMGS